MNVYFYMVSATALCVQCTPLVHYPLLRRFSLAFASSVMIWRPRNTSSRTRPRMTPHNTNPMGMYMASSTDFALSHCMLTRPAAARLTDWRTDMWLTCLVNSGTQWLMTQDSRIEWLMGQGWRPSVLKLALPQNKVLLFSEGARTHQQGKAALVPIACTRHRRCTVFKAAAQQGAGQTGKLCGRLQS